MKTQETQDVKDKGQKMKGADQPKKNNQESSEKKKSAGKKGNGEIHANEAARLEKIDDREKTLYEEIKYYSKEINKTVKTLLKRKEKMDQAQNEKEKAEKELKIVEKKIQKRRETLHQAEEKFKQKEQEYNEILKKIENQKKVLEQLQEA